MVQLERFCLFFAFDVADDFGQNLFVIQIGVLFSLAVIFLYGLGFIRDLLPLLLQTLLQNRLHRDGFAA